MLRRLNASAPARSSCNALVVSQRRQIECMSAWWLASWAMLWQWNLFTFCPIFIMDMQKPGVVANKVATLHYFQEKRTEMKLMNVMDDICTEWVDSVDAAAFDDVAARSLLL
eukprot:PhM_4_TR5589/c0_g1_i1/m.83033